MDISPYLKSKRLNAPCNQHWHGLVREVISMNDLRMISLTSIFLMMNTPGGWDWRWDGICLSILPILAIVYIGRFDDVI